MNGNAVLYDVGKILAAGGAPSYQNSATTTAANIIDISGGGAKVTSTPAMHYGRGFLNSVVLPPGRCSRSAARPSRCRSPTELRHVP